MKLNRSLVMNLMLVMANFIIAAVLYPRIPQRFPTHWNAQGVVDGYGTKPWGVYQGSIILLCFWIGFCLLSTVLPRIKPYTDQVRMFKKWAEYFYIVFIGILLIILNSVLLSAMHINMSLAILAPIFIGLIIVILAYATGNTPGDSLFGIPMPWTTKGDSAGNTANPAYGWLLALAGTVFIIQGPSQLSWLIPTGVLVLVLLLVSVFSYFAGKNTPNQG